MIEIRNRRYIIAAAVIGALALAAFAYFNHARLGTPVILKADTPIQQYSIQGTVNAVHKDSIDLNTSVIVTGPHGNVSEYLTKTVLITDQTTFARLASASGSAGTPLAAAASLADLTAGSSIVVFSSASPLTENTFTATRIELLSE